MTTAERQDAQQLLLGSTARDILMHDKGRFQALFEHRSFHANRTFGAAEPV